MQTSSVADVEKNYAPHVYLVSYPYPPSESVERGSGNETSVYPHSQVFPLRGFDCKNREIKPEDFYPVNSLNGCLGREREGEGGRGRGLNELEVFFIS